MDYKEILEEQHRLGIDKNFELLDELFEFQIDILNLFRESEIHKFDKISILREKIYMLILSREIYKIKLNQYINDTGRGMDNISSGK